MIATYRVMFTVTVDRPELRGPTFPVVRRGAKLPQTWEYSSHTAALSVFDAMLEGHEDYAAEFVSWAAVVATSTTGRPRTIRRGVTRRRPETRAAEMLATLRCHAVRLGRTMHLRTAWI